MMKKTVNKKNSDALSKVTAIKTKLRFTKFLLLAALMMVSFATPVFADDPLAAINGLSTFIFSAIKAIGMIN